MDLLPAAPFIRMPAGRAPFLEGVKCEACGEVHVGRFLACPACAARGRLAPRPLSDTGVVHSYTIVHRSFPGVDVPFVSVVVALDGGGFVKGTLVVDAPTPEAVSAGLPVRTVFSERIGGGGEGRRYLVFGFEPFERG